MQNNLKFVDIFIGSKCNLACFQCDTRSDVVRTSVYDPDMDNIKESIDLVQKNFKVEYYTLLGGEPLLYLKKVEEVLKYIRSIDKTVKIIIPTNATVLHKKFDEVARLLNTYTVSLYICNHYAGFEDTTKSQQIRSVSKQFVEYLNLTKIDQNVFFEELLDWTNKRNDPSLGEYIQRKGTMSLDPTNEVYSSGQYYVWIRDQYEFQSSYYLENNKPKPFQSNNIWDSYINGCCSLMCSFLLNKKLYKCAALGTLEKLLNYHEVLDDPDWEQYLNYQPLDLENCSEDDIKNFSDQKYRAINECSMCPSTSKSFRKVEETVFPIKIVK